MLQQTHRYIIMSIQLHSRAIILREYEKHQFSVTKWCLKMCHNKMLNANISVPNYCQSVSPKQTTLEEDWEHFLDFSSILCLWFKIQGSRTDNFFDWVLNTANILGPFFFYAQFIQGNDGKTRIIWHPTQFSSSFLAMPIKGFHQVKIRNSIFTPFPHLKTDTPRWVFGEFLWNFQDK